MAQKPALYIAAASLALPLAAASADTKPDLKDFVGINGHSVLFRPELYDDTTTLVRDYHNLTLDIDNPSHTPTFSGWPDWDSLYGSWESHGFRINTAVQFSNADLNLFGSGTDAPFKDAAKAYGRAFAQHFGSTAIGGNGLVNSVQIGNEPGDVSDARYKELFRAMATGIREVDPTLTIVSCNVTPGASHAYAKSLSIFNDPAIKPLVDVLATHSYPMSQPYPTWRRSYPEDPAIAYLSDIQRVIDWRNTNGAGKQVWVTEFGYDASTRSPSQDPDNDFRLWEDVTDTQQAQYITRSFLRFTNMDLDRAYLFWANDDDNPQLHGSSGITRGYVPKPSYWAMKHLRETLGGHRFNRVIEQSAADLYIYEYLASEDADEVVWAIWSPTGTNRETLVTLDEIGGQAMWADRMPLASAAAPRVGVEELGDGRVRVLVGESPVYLRIAIPEPATAGLLLTGGALLIPRRRTVRGAILNADGRR